MRTVTYDENEWALVPKVMTDDMRDAGNIHTLNRAILNMAWNDALAAAPDHPATAWDAEDAARYRLIRRKVCIAGGQFHVLNLHPRYVAPDAAIELDAAIDAMRTSTGGE